MRGCGVGFGYPRSRVFAACLVLPPKGCKNAVSVYEPTTDRRPGRPLFTTRQLMLLPIAFVTVMVLGNLAVRHANSCLGGHADVPRMWPMSIVALRIPGLIRAPARSLLVAFGVGAAFLLLMCRLSRITSHLGAVVLAGLGLIVATNLIQGWHYGLEGPVTSGIRSVAYYDDAIHIRSAWGFLESFEQLQPVLLNHSRTHPPGAVLIYYVLAKALGSPALISLAIAMSSTVLSAVFFRAMLASRLGPEGSRYGAFLLLLVPSVQIYYLASLDAVVAALLLGALVCFLHPRTVIGVLGTVVCLAGASFLTFGFVFLLPVLAGLAIVHRRLALLLRLAGVGAILFVLYAALRWASGFNYLHAFWIASAIENPNGFRLLDNPADYALTRLECVAEVVLFLGPFLTTLYWRSLRTILRDSTYRSLLASSLLGVVTLVGMFLTGAFRTGETARACLFIVPYLIIPVMVYLHKFGADRKEWVQLATLVFGQALLMQTVLGFLW